MKPVIKCLKSTYIQWMLSTQGSLFCALFNFRAWLRNKDIRFNYDNKSRQYTASGSGRTLLFYHSKQANMAYQDGIMERGMTLGDTYFLPRISFSDHDLIVDCGANVGDLHLYFQQKGIHVSYIGFEPSQLEFECLKVNVEPGTSCNLGLWDSEGTLEFFSSSAGADSSLIQPPTYDEIVKVNVNRLDALVTKPIKLLKIEAEGAEPEVLKGCEKLLPQIEYISADLGFERGIKQESTLAPVINYLLSRNFELLDVSHVRVVALFRNKNFS